MQDTKTVTKSHTHCFDNAQFHENIFPGVSLNSLNICSLEMVAFDLVLHQVYHAGFFKGIDTD